MCLCDCALLQFDVEWDNDAELILADMEFVEGEPQAERDLKVPRV